MFRKVHSGVKVGYINSFLILKSSDIITTSVCPQDSQNYFAWIISIESYNLIKYSLLSLSDNSKVKKIK